MRNVACSALLLAALLALPAWASPDATAAKPELSDAPPLCECSPVDDLALSRLRGGFDDHQGLTASIGLERLTMVNGVVVSTLNLQISDLSKVSTQQAHQLQTTLAALGIVNGGGNLSAMLQGASAGTTVIQNSLSNQSISNATVLSISTNSQQFIKASNLRTTLQDALALPLSGH